jgi:hypothetical protein
MWRALHVVAEKAESNLLNALERGSVPPGEFAVSELVVTGPELVDRARGTLPPLVK